MDRCVVECMCGSMAVVMTVVGGWVVRMSISGSGGGGGDDGGGWVVR